jgi:hypothetical protein
MLKYLTCAMALPLLISASALAANPHTGGVTGQPHCDCAATPTPPGNASTAPGSAFNSISGIAGTKYAGIQPQNSKNQKSVSQYDAACFQQSQH